MSIEKIEKRMGIADACQILQREFMPVYFTSYSSRGGTEGDGDSRLGHVPDIAEEVDGLEF